MCGSRTAHGNRLFSKWIAGQFSARKIDGAHQNPGISPHMDSQIMEQRGGQSQSMSWETQLNIPVRERANTRRLDLLRRLLRRT